MKTVISMIGIIVILLFTSTVNARTDWKCMDDCHEKGYMYGYCKRLCSF